MRRFVKEIMIICISAFILMNVLSYASLSALRKSSFYKPSFLVNQVEKQDFDYVILGASTGLTTLNSTAVDSILGTSGINMSMDDTGIASQYMMLQHFLAQGKTTKYCILAPNPSSFDRSYTHLSDNDYRFLPYVSESYVNEYYDQFNATEATLMSSSRWLPALGVSYYNTELFYPSVFSVFNPEQRNRFDRYGNYTYPLIENSNTPIRSKSSLELKFKNTNVEAIKKLCELHNIRLICYISPMQQKSITTNTRQYQVINHSNLFENTMYFYDAIHVNHKGRQRASAQFAFDFQTILE